MTAKQFTKALVVLALVVAGTAVSAFAARFYLGYVADKELAEVIFGNMDACKTAPVGEWHKASDFSSNKSAGPTP